MDFVLRSYADKVVSFYPFMPYEKFMFCFNFRLAITPCLEARSDFNESWSRIYKMNAPLGFDTSYR